ncbi:hypothetical protein [Moraxella lacunata]
MLGNRPTPAFAKNNAHKVGYKSSSVPTGLSKRVSCSHAMSLSLKV